MVTCSLAQQVEASRRAFSRRFREGGRRGELPLLERRRRCDRESLHGRREMQQPQARIVLEAHQPLARVAGEEGDEFLDVKVEVEDGNVLKISGQKTREEEHKDDAWNRVERSFGSFMRRFRLPENARAEGIRCTMQDGVLRVVVPKDEDAQKQRNVRSIDIA
ncbi:17.6 kDa class I heat shock protein-like [Lolium rigidum]|uniref:17.6 kDa class I heat shock protein-like n=1 Tax=Lolium rigidum TaxID=89674 RepID=UPI001F5C2B9E|nr:17.6 kDa class I heat shock protein-like [Lolium rigidum]